MAKKNLIFCQYFTFINQKSIKHPSINRTAAKAGCIATFNLKESELLPSESRLQFLATARGD